MDNKKIGRVAGWIQTPKNGGEKYISLNISVGGKKIRAKLFRAKEKREGRKDPDYTGFVDKIESDTFTKPSQPQSDPTYNLDVSTLKDEAPF